MAINAPEKPTTQTVDQPFTPVTFYHPRRKNLQIVVPGRRGKRLRFVDGRYVATSPIEVELIRNACGNQAYTDDIADDQPDLVVEPTGWRTRSLKAFTAEYSRLVKHGG